MFHMRESKQKGFSLIELGIVIAVVGVGLIFTVSKIRETKITSRAQKANRDLVQIITNAQRVYSTSRTFPGTWDNALLVRNNVFPASWVAGGNVVSPFGGLFRIDTQPVTAATPDTAAIVLDNVPSKVCAELGQLMAGSSAVVGMWTGGSPPRDVKNLASGEVNVANLGLGCAESSNVGMAFYFARN